MRVIRDTPVREGAAAARIAWVAITGSVMLLALAAGLVFAGERVVALLGLSAQARSKQLFPQALAF
jgi:hypothetical protein